jgi:hypothetical protein
MMVVAVMDEFNECLLQLDAGKCKSAFVVMLLGKK